MMNSYDGSLTITTAWIILASSTFYNLPLQPWDPHPQLQPSTIQFLWETILSTTTLIYCSFGLYSNRFYPFPELLRSASFSSFKNFFPSLFLSVLSLCCCSGFPLTMVSGSHSPVVVLRLFMEVASLFVEHGL